MLFSKAKDAARPRNKNRKLTAGWEPAFLDDKNYFLRIIELLDSDSDSELNWMVPVPQEQAILLEQQKTIEEVNIITILNNFRHTDGPRKVDRSTKYMIRSIVQAKSVLTIGTDIMDKDTDKNFTYMVTNKPTYRDIMIQDDAPKYRLAIKSEVDFLQRYHVFCPMNENQSDKSISTMYILI